MNSKLDKGCPVKNVGFKKCCAVRIGGGGEVNIGNVEEEGCPKINPKEYCCENELNFKLDKECQERNVGSKKCGAVSIGGGGKVNIGKNVEEEGCPKIDPNEYCCENMRLKNETGSKIANGRNEDDVVLVGGGGVNIRVAVAHARKRLSCVQITERSENLNVN